MNRSNPEQLSQLILDTLIAVAPDVEPGALDPDVAFRDQFEIDSVDFLNFVVRLEKQLDRYWMGSQVQRRRAKRARQSIGHAMARRQTCHGLACECRCDGTHHAEITRSKCSPARLWGNTFFRRC